MAHDTESSISQSREFSFPSNGPSIAEDGTALQSETMHGSTITVEARFRAVFPRTDTAPDLSKLSYNATMRGGVVEDAHRQARRSHGKAARNPCALRPG